MKLTKLIFVLSAALTMPAIAVAEPAAGDVAKKAPAAPRISADDLAVLQHHHDVNLMEIDMGKMAQAKGSEGVKKYAVALVKDHEKADKDALALAKARGVVLKDHAMPANDVEAADHKKQMETMKRLETLGGAEFEREYLAAMIDGHTAEVGYMTVAIGKVTDAKLKAHLTKMKPVIERHAEQAKALLTPATALKPTRPATPATPPAAK